MNTAMPYRHHLRVAVEAAKAAGEILRAELHRKRGPRGTRHHCPADDEAEALIRDRIEAAFPRHGIIGEELGGRNKPAADRARHCWVIDPNDGTSAFSQRRRGSAISIALLKAGIPVLGVVYAFCYPDDDGDLIAWAEGEQLTRNGVALPPREWCKTLSSNDTVLVSDYIAEASLAGLHTVAPARFRAMPSIAYRLALVAVGDAAAAVSTGSPVSWDYAAGHALLRGAGGELVGADGTPVVYSEHGSSWCGGACFGGAPHVVADLASRSWEQNAVPSRRSARIRGLVTDAGVLSRAQGCMLGLIAGDSLGSLVEFQSAESIARAYLDGPRLLADGGTWGTIAGQPTDDSELALALARCLVSKRNFSDDAVATAYATWYRSSPFDIGSTTAQAFSAAARARSRPAAAARKAANATSQANGALMRIAPLGIFGWKMSPGTLAEIARRDATLSHPHPVCQDASAVFVVAAQRAIATGDGGSAVYNWVRDWATENTIESTVVEAVVSAENAPPRDYQASMGWVLIALQNAFWQLLHAETLEAGVVDTVRRGGDTDTNAAIAGALLGSVHGFRAIPRQWRDRILTCRPVAGVPGVRQPRPEVYWPVDAMELAEQLLVASRPKGG